MSGQHSDLNWGTSSNSGNLAFRGGNFTLSATGNYNQSSGAIYATNIDTGKTSGAINIGTGNSQTGAINFGTGTGTKPITIGGAASTVAINGTTNITGTTTVTGTLITTNDASINTLTVGKGGGNVSNNSAFGFQALKSNTTGSTNTAIGANSLYLNTSGGSNTAIGYNSLNSNTTGSNNIAIGGNTLLANTSGTSNTAIGAGTLQTNNGSSNTGIGLSSLQNNTTGQNNTAIGSTSSIRNTTGGNNTTIGYQALYSNTIGGNNTAIGESAGFDLSGNSGSNTFLGSGADVSSNTLIYNYSTAVGFNATIDASNQMVLGGNASSVPYPSIKIPGSYVGINGAYNPASGFVLDVSGNGRFNNSIYLYDGANNSVINKSGSNLSLINNNAGGNIVISNSNYLTNSFTFNFDSSGNKLIFNDNSSDTAFIRWYSPSDSTSYLQFGTTDNAQFGASEIIYFTQYEYSNTTTYVRMRIDGTGVWINPSGDTNFTTASTYSLNVNGNTNISGTTFTNSIQSSDPTANINIGTTLTTGNINLGTSMTSGTISVGGATTSTATINIGIGTSQTGPINIGSLTTGNALITIGSAGSGSQVVNINGAVITVGGSNTQTLTLTPANVSTFNLGSNMTGGQIQIGMNSSTASNQAVNINTGSSQTGQINLGTGASAKTITIGSAAATVAVNGNFLISQTTLPASSTTQLGYTFNSTASTTIGSDYTALANLSVIAGVYMVTAQCDVYYSPYPPNYTSWLRLSLNTTSSTSFNDACAQDYFPSATTGNFYIRITGIFTVSSSSNIYVVGRYGDIAPSTTSTVLSYTRIG